MIILYSHWLIFLSLILIPLITWSITWCATSTCWCVVCFINFWCLGIWKYIFLNKNILRYRHIDFLMPRSYFALSFCKALFSLSGGCVGELGWRWPLLIELFWFFIHISLLFCTIHPDNVDCLHGLKIRTSRCYWLDSVLICVGDCWNFHTPLECLMPDTKTEWLPAEEWQNLLPFLAWDRWLWWSSRQGYIWESGTGTNG